VALSRYEETPRQLVIELNAEGTDYLAHGSFAEEEFASTWQVLRQILLPANGMLTRSEILDRWPGEERPDPAGLYRWLKRGVAQKLLRREGRGKRRDPFRYCLPETRERWLKDPMSVIDWENLPGASGGGGRPG
jgi:hypothetical protein